MCTKRLLEGGLFVNAVHATSWWAGSRLGGTKAQGQQIYSLPFGGTPFVREYSGFAFTPMGRTRSARNPLRYLLKLTWTGGSGRDRTFEGARPADLQSAPFDHFGTDPHINY